MNTTDFCVDPYNAVCGDFDLTISDHVRRYEEAKGLARAAGLVAAAQYAIAQGWWHGSPTAFRQADADRIDGDRRIPIVMRFMLKAARAAGVTEYLTSRSKYGLASSDEIRRHLFAAVNARLGGQSLINARNIVTDVQIIGAEEAFRPGQDAAVRDGFIHACGEDGLTFNAFANTVVGGKRVVFFCTGSVLAAQFDYRGDPVGSQEAATNNLVWALGHEIAHHLGWPVNYDPFLAGTNAPYNQCLLDHYPKLYNANQRGEAQSDFWAAETTAERLRSAAGAAPGGDAAHRLLILQQSWGKLCETGAGAAHPSGRMRIEVLLRLNPEVSDVMGCARPQAPDPPGCDLSGSVR
jgi:hypothetical protein